MRDVFEKIRQQIHDIRNFLGPADVTLSNLNRQIGEIRVLLNERIDGIESRLLVHKYIFDERDLQVLGLLERIEQIELTLNALPDSTRTESTPP